MRAVIQRVREAKVRVNGAVVGEIAEGMVVLLAVGRGDTSPVVRAMAEKTAQLRIFGDEHGKMNASLLECGGAALVVSQFTLYGDVRHGRRPGFDGAAPPDEALPMYEEYVERLREQGVRVKTGVFRVRMELELVNDGPVTILMDSEKMF